ncbi:MAG TPA: anthranilate synthase component I [Xanthomonadales bacterium]|nr:anthranilate synthase component I [Xanthomonadales bacterium]
MTDAAHFDRLAAEGHTRIPVVREVLSDLDTPLSVYLKLADGPHTYLFESVEGGETWARFSIIGLPARRSYRFRGHRLDVYDYGELVEQREVADPLGEVERLRSAHRVPKIDGLPAFTGGLVGYFGFECIGYIEPRLAGPLPDGRELPDQLDTSDIFLLLSEEVAVFDNLKGRLYLIVHADPSEAHAYARAQRRLDALVHRLRHAGASYPDVLAPDVLSEADFVSGFSREDFIAAVERSKDYIRAGDVFQVVLSQRMSVPFKARPVDVYRALRALNPSPYMYFLDLADVQVVGSSPEILARLQDGTVTVRPIAGTRPRGATPEADAALEAELLADPKERAEHLMLIDLGRNDVGRVAAEGSVSVTERNSVEFYSHVMHIVSNVRGDLAAGKDAIDLLRATFPAGTVSGAPKVRAMQIIAELEAEKRGAYAGGVGYFSPDGSMDSCIVLRTAVLKDGVMHAQAGAGIVADSTAAYEQRECEAKAGALVAAAKDAIARAREPGFGQ